MSTRNSRTANSHEMSDSLTKLQLEKDDLFELFVENDSELKEGDYEGEVLAMQKIPGTPFHKAMIRIPQLHDSQIPTAICQDDPTRAPRFTNAQQKLLVYNHVCAIAEIPLGDTESDTDTVSEEADDAIFCEQFVSMRVLVRFKQSPNQRGKTRFAKFRIPQLSKVPSRKANGCYNIDCTGGGLPDGFMGANGSFFAGGGFGFGGAGAQGGEGGNPPHNTKLTKQERTTKKGDKIKWPIAFTVTPWKGELYDDIINCPYKSHEGLNYFVDETKGMKMPYKEGQAGKANLFKHKSTLLGREFMHLLASKLNFDLNMTSNFRGPASNAGIMADTTFEHILQKTGGLNKYRKKRDTYIKLYNKVKARTKEKNPKKGGRTYKELKAEIVKMFTNKKTGHSVGGAVDISSRVLTRQQVSDVLYTCYYMGVSWVMLEHHIPHIHVAITKDTKTFSKPSDYNDPAKVKKLLEKFNKRYTDKAPDALPSMGSSVGVSKSASSSSTSATTNTANATTTQELADSAAALFDIASN